MQKKENGKRIFAGRALALAVVLLLALGLCACGKKGGDALAHTGIADITLPEGNRKPLFVASGLTFLQQAVLQ